MNAVNLSEIVGLDFATQSAEQALSKAVGTTDPQAGTFSQMLEGICLEDFQVATQEGFKSVEKLLAQEMNEVFDSDSTVDRLEQLSTAEKGNVTKEPRSEVASAGDTAAQAAAVSFVQPLISGVQVSSASDSKVEATDESGKSVPNNIVSQTSLPGAAATRQPVFPAQVSPQIAEKLSPQPVSRLPADINVMPVSSNGQEIRLEDPEPAAVAPVFPEDQESKSADRLTVVDAQGQASDQSQPGQTEAAADRQPVFPESAMPKVQMAAESDEPDVNIFAKGTDDAGTSAKSTTESGVKPNGLSAGTLSSPGNKQTPLTPTQTFDENSRSAGGVEKLTSESVAMENFSNGFSPDSSSQALNLPTLNSTPPQIDFPLDLSEISKNVISQIVSRAQLIVKGNGAEMKIKLRPPALGDLTIRVIMEEGLLTARLNASSQIVKGVLENALPQLKQSLEDRGVKLDRFIVDIGGDHVTDGAGGERSFSKTARDFNHHGASYETEKGFARDASSNQSMFGTLPLGKLNILI